MILGNSVGRAIKVDATTVSARRDSLQESVSSLTFLYPSSLRLWYLENGERWNTRDFTSLVLAVGGMVIELNYTPKINHQNSSKLPLLTRDFHLPISTSTSNF